MTRTTEFMLGQHFEQVVVENLSRTQIVMYAGASGDFNPVHHDETFATKVGYPSVLAHGMLTMALTGRILTDTVTNATLTSFGGRFLSQVWPGDTLTAHATVEEVTGEDDYCLVKFALSTTNQAGTEVFAGYATAMIDK